MKRFNARYGLVGLLLAMSASAEQPRLTTVVVALEPALEGQALSDWRALDAATAASPRHTFVDLNEAMAPELAARRKKAAAAQAAYAEALAAFDDANMPAALAKATQAINAFEASDLSQGFPVYVDCMAFRAMLLHLLKPDAAAKEFKRLFTLAPGYRLDSPRFNPGFIKLAKEGAAKFAATPKTSIALTASGVRAMAYVDGVFRGVTPLTVSEITPGAHVVTMLSPGRGIAQETAVAGPGRKLEARFPVPSGGNPVDPELERLRGGLRRGQGGEAAAALAKRSGAEEVLVVGLTAVEEGMQATLLHVRQDGRQTLRVLVSPPGSVEERVRAALALLEQLPVNLSPVLSASAGETPTVSRTGPAGWQPRTWGFVSIGAGVLAATGGVLIGLSAQQQALDTGTIPRTDAGYEPARGGAVRTAIVADACYGAALVGTGLGTWLLLTNRWPWAPQTADKRPQLQPGVVPLRQGGAAVFLQGTLP